MAGGNSVCTNWANAVANHKDTQSMEFQAKRSMRHNEQSLMVVIKGLSGTQRALQWPEWYDTEI